MEGLGKTLKEVHFGTPVCRIILKSIVRREVFQVNPFGYGMDNLERYGVASRIARNLVEAPVWHYTDKGNLVCGDGKDIETLPVQKFTIVIDDNIDFLIEMMCPCGSDRLSAHKLFAVGVITLVPVPKEGERNAGTQYSSFIVTLGKIQE